MISNRNTVFLAIAGCVGWYLYSNGAAGGETGVSGSATATEIRRPIHLSVVCDASDSGDGLTCTKDTLLVAFNTWIKNSLTRRGSTLSVTQTGRSRDTARSVLKIQVPDTWGARVSASKARFVADARRRIREVSVESNGSSVAEAINVAATRLAEMNGDKQLLVMSDMRQVTQRMWNFERRVPSPRAFVRWAERRGLLSDLSRVRVVACGVHTRRAPQGPDHTALLETRMRNAWKAAFEKMGSVDVPMLSSCEESTLLARLSPGNDSRFSPTTR